MQLSAPILPFDLATAMPAGAGVPAGAAVGAPAATTDAFSAILSAETLAPIVGENDLVLAQPGVAVIAEAATTESLATPTANGNQVSPLHAAAAFVRLNRPTSAPTQPENFVGQWLVPDAPRELAASDLLEAEPALGENEEAGIGSFQSKHHREAPQASEQTILASPVPPVIAPTIALPMAPTLSAPAPSESEKPEVAAADVATSERLTPSTQPQSRGEVREPSLRSANSRSPQVTQTPGSNPIQAERSTYAAVADARIAPGSASTAKSASRPQTSPVASEVNSSADATTTVAPSVGSVAIDPSTTSLGAGAVPLAIASQPDAPAARPQVGVVVEKAKNPVPANPANVVSLRAPSLPSAVEHGVEVPLQAAFATAAENPPPVVVTSQRTSPMPAPQITGPESLLAPADSSANFPRSVSIRPPVIDADVDLLSGVAASGPVEVSSVRGAGVVGSTSWSVENVPAVEPTVSKGETLPMLAGREGRPSETIRGVALPADVETPRLTKVEVSAARVPLQPSAPLDMPTPRVRRAADAAAFSAPLAVPVEASLSEPSAGAEIDPSQLAAPSASTSLKPQIAVADVVAPQTQPRTVVQELKTAAPVVDLPEHFETATALQNIAPAPVAKAPTLVSDTRRGRVETSPAPVSPERVSSEGSAPLGTTEQRVAQKIQTTPAPETAVTPTERRPLEATPAAPVSRLESASVAEPLRQMPIVSRLAPGVSETVAPQPARVSDSPAPAVQENVLAEFATVTPPESGVSPLTSERPRSVSKVEQPSSSALAEDAAEPFVGAKVMEKFAGYSEADPIRFPSLAKTGLKKSLSFADELLTKPAQTLGTNAAKSGTVMPALATSPSPTPAAIESPAFSAVPLTFESLAKDAAVPTSEVAQAARRAVDSAMAVVEHFTKGDQKSVNLQFTVSGVDLAVRVEMRGDAVHTTFRTDSPELRNALAHEWQVVSSQSGERTQRLAEPVFTSAPAGNSANADLGSAHHREPGARHNAPAAPEFSGFRNTGRPSSPSPATPAPAVVPRSASVSTSQRLNTFA